MGFVFTSEKRKTAANDDGTTLTTAATRTDASSTKYVQCVSQCTIVEVGKICISLSANKRQIQVSF